MHGSGLTSWWNSREQNKKERVEMGGKQGQNDNDLCRFVDGRREMGEKRGDKLNKEED